MPIKKIIQNLEQQKAVLEKELDAVGRALSALTKSRQPRAKKQGKRHMSAAARERISQAQKKRWAAQRKK
jgi:hypothetical protein